MQLDDTLGGYFHVLFKVHRFLSDSQIKNHVCALLHLRGFLGREPLISDLTDDTIASMMRWVVSVKGRAPRTANKSRDCLLAQWRFYARKGIVSRWPDVGALPEPQEIPVCWTKPELKRLFAACSRQEGWIGGIPAASWWHALHATCYDTAERIMPVLRLAWGAVDLRSRVITFKAADRKGGRKANQQPIHRQTVRLLRSIRGESELVFPTDFCLGTLYNRYDKLLREAGLPHGRESKFHRIRKTSASWFEAAGGNATDFLGHSSRRVTLRYLDPRVTVKTRPCDELFRPTGS